MAETCFAVGDRARAKEYGARAVAAADNPRLQQQLEKRVQAYEEKE
jgi:hypothetical protein